MGDEGGRGSNGRPGVTAAPESRRALQNAAFLLLVVLTTIAFFALIKDFLMPVFWAAVLATLFHPLHVRYLDAVRGRNSVAALLSVLTIVGVVVLPLAAIGVAMAREAIALHDLIASGAVDLGAPLRFVKEITPLVGDYLHRYDIDIDRLGQQLSSAALGVTQFLASRLVSVGQNILQFTVLLFLMLYVLFFFLRDGRRITAALVHALPLGDVRERRLLSRFGDVTRATIKGTLVVGLVQGTIGGVTFWALGIPAPVFWGAVMTVLAFLPAVGPAIVWVPAAVILLVLGHVLKGLVLIGVGVLVIGLVDNVLRPILVGRDVGMPDYLVLLATLGGLTVFGISGFVLGPVIAGFFLTVWEMFAEEQSAGGA
jgi:predicted PurR-regulated permease PerM